MSLLRSEKALFFLFYKHFAPPELRPTAWERDVEREGLGFIL